MVHRDCPDPVFELPGAWQFRRCPRCASLWLDPRPAPAARPALYPGRYYTHVPPPAPLAAPPGRLARRAFSAKLAVVAEAYGYAGLASRAPQDLSALGRLARRVPALRRWAGFYVRFLPYQAGGRLLDAGCGNGAFLLQMQALGWEVAGLEPDPAAAALATAAGLPVAVADLAGATLPGERYDAITLAHVLEHVADPGVVLARLSAALRPGGRLVSISPNPAGLLAGWFGCAWRGLEPPRHLVLPSPAGYRLLLARLGLRGQVWTSLRTLPWMGRESLAIRRAGQIGADPGRLAPAALGLVTRLAALPLPEAGEEVVVVATK